MRSLARILCLSVCLTALWLPGGQRAFAQGMASISGVVVDEEGQPLVAAGVLFGKDGVVSDLDGKFSIKVPAGKLVTLTFSYLGYQARELSVAPGTSGLRVELKPDSQLEAAVINAGYGVIQKRENLTGSAYQITSDRLADQPATRIDNLLAGQVPGLRVLESTNSTGRTTLNLRVRGDGSISASSEPLWIIDGVPVYTGGITGSNMVGGVQYSVSPLSLVNPDDIESITILKDASTTALYGADGANGVVLVTTKGGRSGKITMNASVKYGFSAIDRSTTVRRPDAASWMALAKEAWVNAGKSLAIFPYQDNEYNTYSQTDTDWYKVYTGVGQSLQANFSAHGGSDRMRNYFSASWYDNSTVYTGNTQKRFSLRDKVTLAFSDRLEVTANLSGSYSVNNIFSISSSFDEYLPIFSPYADDGGFRMYNWYSKSDDAYLPQFYVNTQNNLPERKYNDNYQNTLSTDADLVVEWKPWRDLSVTSTTGASLMNIYEAMYSSRLTRSGQYTDGRNGSSHRAGVFSTVLNENLRANYKHVFNRLRVSAMGGVEWKDSQYPTLYASGHGFVNDHIKEVNYADASTREGGSNNSHTRSLSYIGHASATWDNRYTLTLSARRQGYSSFSEFARWGTFSSAGLSWNIAREHFFHSNVISALNMKVSYGNNGNSRVDTSAAYGAYTLTEANYYGGQPGANQSSPANPGLSWEKTDIANLGVNIGLWKRINLSLEGYYRKTHDILYGGRVSSAITSDKVTRNIGEMRNSGFEFDLETVNIDNSSFQWRTEINGAHNETMITKLYKDAYTGYFTYIVQAGASKNAWWLVRWAGVDPTTGAPMWYDKDGNLTYSFSYDNRVLLPQYSKEPTLSGGMSNDFRFKRLGLSVRVMLDYQIGGWDLFYLVNDGYDIITDNTAVEALEHWTTPGVSADNPAFVYKHNYHTSLGSTRNLYRTTYVQVRNVSVTYDLPKKWVKPLHLASCSLSLLADNLYLWTPAQRSDRNSYKTLKYSSGMTRTLSGRISLQF